MDNGGKLIKEYKINASTVAVLPILYGNRIFSKIFDLGKGAISPFKPMDIVKESCMNNGSTYEGRKMAARRFIGTVHKVPIAISPLIYLFPTTSPENPHCIWIAYDHVIGYKKGELNCMTIVEFSNNQLIPIPISPSSFKNQLVRTMMLKTKLSKMTSVEHSNSIYTSEAGIQLSAENQQKYY